MQYTCFSFEMQLTSSKILTVNQFCLFFSQKLFQLFSKCKNQNAFSFSKLELNSTSLLAT